MENMEKTKQRYVLKLAAAAMVLVIFSGILTLLAHYLG